jgi:intracellular multiplication protein IcmL
MSKDSTVTEELTIENIEKTKLNHDYQSAPINEINRVCAENAALKLDLLLAKKANLRIWLLVGIMAIILSIAIYMWLAVFPKYKYIVTTNNQAICQAGLSDNPLVTPATLSAYALDAVVNSYTYDYINYRSVLNRVADTYYTSNGRKAFFKSLDQSQNLRRVIEGRYILRAYPINAPQVEQQGISGTQKFWVVKVPIAIEFYSGNLGKPQSRKTFLASVTLVQEPASALNLKGIAVDGLVLQSFVSTNK